MGVFASIGAVIALAVKYGPDLISLIKAAWGLEQAIKDKIDAKKTDKAVDQAQATKDSTALEDALKNGNHP